MRCKVVKRLLNGLMDNELVGEIQDTVKGHLEGCKECSHRLKELTKLKEMVRTSTPYTANPFLWTRIANSIKEEMPVPIGILIPRILRLWIPIASVLTIVCGLALFNLIKTEEPADRGALSTILDMPITPENMEKITLNLIVYTNGITQKEMPYVQF